MTIPYWCGIRGIRFIYHGDYSDPEVTYRGHRFNVHDVEDAMWEDYCEDGGDDYDTDKFANWCYEHAEQAKEYLDCIIEYRREETREQRRRRQAA